MKKDDIKPYMLAQASAKFLNESYNDEELGDEWYYSNPTTEAIEEQWEAMVNEIKAMINFDRAVSIAAKKYFPGLAPKIAEWAKRTIKLIWTDGYPEDWNKFENCTEEFGDAMKIKPAQFMKLSKMRKGVSEVEKKEELDETEPEDGEGDNEA